MGRYSEPLAARFADLAGVRRGQRALDVGCGPGALTAELVGRLGAGAVCAVDPSGPFAQAGLDEVHATTLTVQVRHATFEEWWQPFTLGVGPAGDYVASLPGQRRQVLRERCREMLGGGPVDVSATVWAVTAVAPRG